MVSEDAFSIGQAMGAQRAMRDALGLAEEVFPLPAFIGMVSDEIQMLREAGRSDGEIAEIVSAGAGRVVSAEDLGRFYVAERK